MRSAFILILANLLGSVVGSIAFAQAFSCQQIHGNYTATFLRAQLYQELRENGAEGMARFLENQSGLSMGLILGNKTPDWLDFQTLKIAHDGLLTQIKEIREKGGEPAVQDFYKKLDKASSYFSRRREMGADYKTPDKVDYGPTDYGLRLAYRKEFLKLNRLLPSQMRFELKDLPADTKKIGFYTQGKEAVTELEDSVQKMFATTSGFTSKEALVEKLRNTDSVKPMLEFIENDKNTSFAMNRPENARWWVPKVGFQNQRVTGSSKGMMSPNYRDYVEASRSGSIIDGYKKLDPDIKPKYGFLIPKLNSGLARNNNGYGPDTYIFKKKNLRDRTTWTVGDSFANVPVSPDGRHSYSAGEFLSAGHPQEWHQFFVPWSMREMMVPNVQNVFNKLPLEGTYAPDVLTRESETPFKGPARTYGYIELQYWGPLTIHDLEAFVFSVNPPEGDFLNALIEHKIPIFKAEIDFKTYTPWSPPAKAEGDIK